MNSSKRGVLRDFFFNKNDFFMEGLYFIWYRYGVQEFIILAPKNPKDFIDSESRTNLLLSSIGMALNNLKWYGYYFWRIIIEYLTGNILSKSDWYFLSFKNSLPILYDDVSRLISKLCNFMGFSVKLFCSNNSWCSLQVNHVVSNVTWATCVIISGVL